VVALLGIGDLLCVGTGDSVAQVCGAEIDVDSWALTIETAKANDIEPYDYLLHILKHIGTADTPEKLEALLPWNMKSEGAQQG
jgi:hypothetical protein